MFLSTRGRLLFRPQEALFYTFTSEPQTLELSLLILNLLLSHLPGEPDGPGNLQKQSQ